jgi:hypothetical protein
MDRLVRSDTIEPPGQTTPLEPDFLNLRFLDFGIMYAAVEFWGSGVLEFWSTGVLEHWASSPFQP